MDLFVFVVSRDNVDSDESGCIGAIAIWLIFTAFLLTGLMMDFSILYFALFDIEHIIYGFVITGLVWTPSILLCMFGKPGILDFTYHICYIPFVLVLLYEVFFNGYDANSLMVMAPCILIAAYIPSRISKFFIMKRHGMKIK